ncbi:MAG: NAD-dependent deacylase [Chloroflexi bacterium]|mgnify:FL=1|nr:NAD-dependent deacylase [Chloroflexota bacterium]MBK6710805.1 NAD-dependent deacylase [Chloroflexota bacterium]MBK7176489.1 NAD-dependent deacylase [Chloroflexota bacterium]MBK7915470.1 NAD-dependent deacylase [Chloroflexota bacterium]MBK8933934.1 NAD-dependent deacylase [Chloroflexota bacterium]
MDNLESQINQALDILQKARHVVALTGAGISTRSGIPDFRSPESGLWDRYDPMEVATMTAFKQTPQRFYEWINPLLQTIMTAQPNSAHLALAQLEAHGPLKAVITQNIDALHARAGSKTIYEVHGHLREATCMHCLQTYQTEVVMADYLVDGQVPRCPACGGILKPNIILFGEILPVTIMNRAKRHARDCDVMIVAGSSLEVAPAGDLPMLAKYAGAKLIIVNFSETHLDYLADVLIHADVVDILPRLAASYTPHGL